MTAPVDPFVVFVGGGQAGLAAAWHLRRRRLRFLVLEAAGELGHTWRTRWDSLRLLRDGRVVHARGITDVSGLYFLGLPWQHTRGSALLGFVADDAAHVATHLARTAAATDALTPQP